jgi:outer membrane receptor protein involved in Fe transport
LRNDDIRNGLFHTERRVRLDTTTFASTNETSLSPYVQNVTHWTPWLRTIAGARADLFWFDTATLAGSGGTGQVSASQFSPKLGIALGPWEKTELYANFGYGFHSNDARGVVDSARPATPLTRAVGAETGLRTSFIPNLQTSVSAWLLNIQSELTWVGDEGTTEPSGRTRRYGIELANFYTPTPWLTLDFDYAWSHSRFVDFDPAGQHIPEALAATIDGGIAVHNLDGRAKNLFGGLRLRYFGPRTLTQDNLVRSRATTLLYADLGYNLTPNMAITLNVFNLLDEKSSDIDYFYASRLPGEPASGVDDIHTHPSEPRTIRVSLSVTL